MIHVRVSKRIPFRAWTWTEECLQITIIKVPPHAFGTYGLFLSILIFLFILGCGEGGDSKCAQFHASKCFWLWANTSFQHEIHASVCTWGLWWTSCWLMWYIYRVALILVHLLLVMSSPGNSSLVLPEPRSHSRDTFPRCISKARKSTWTQHMETGDTHVLDEGTTWSNCAVLKQHHCHH